MSFKEWIKSHKGEVESTLMGTCIVVIIGSLLILFWLHPDYILKILITLVVIVVLLIGPIFIRFIFQQVKQKFKKD